MGVTVRDFLETSFRNFKRGLCLETSGISGKGLMALQGPCYFRDVWGKRLFVRGFTLRSPLGLRGLGKAAFYYTEDVA